MNRVLVTGGSGFIGSNFLRYFLNKFKDISVINLDKLTYAGRMENLSAALTSRRHRFVKADIADERRMAPLVKEADLLVNFAAETHVDRSIGDPAPFLRSNVQGVFVLLELAKKYGIRRFLQIGTDEVYGPVMRGAAPETAPLNPRNPYSASKASADLLVRSYYLTFGLPVLITRSSNNYGPRQFPEKVLPVVIACALRDQPIPVYGDGLQVRDWTYVVDNCRGVDLVLRKGSPGEIYNVSSTCEMPNLAMVKMVLRLLGKPQSLIRHVQDRPGHDRRYAIHTTKVKRLGFRPKMTFAKGLKETVEWYVNRFQSTQRALAPTLWHQLRK